MGGSSRSSTSSTQQTTNIQDIDTTTIGLDNIGEDSTAVAGVSGDVSITQISTDQGAIEAGRRIGESALDFAGEQSGAAFDFGSDALTTLERGLDRSFDFGSEVAEQAFGFGADSLRSVENTTNAAVSELGRSINKVADATRSDSSLALENVVKYVAVAGAAIFGIYFISRAA